MWLTMLQPWPKKFYDTNADAQAAVTNFLVVIDVVILSVIPPLVPCYFRDDV